MLKTISKVIVALAMVAVVIGASAYILPAVADQSTQQGYLQSRDRAMARDTMQTCEYGPSMQRDRMHSQDRLRDQELTGECSEDCPCGQQSQHGYGGSGNYQNQSTMGHQYHGHGGGSSPMGGMGMQRHGFRP
jgi:hypothetical protein